MDGFYSFVDGAIVSVPERLSKSLRQILRIDALPGVVSAKFVPRYEEKFLDAATNREFAKATQACNNMDDSDLDGVPSLVEQRAFVRSLTLSALMTCP